MGSEVWKQKTSAAAKNLSPVSEGSFGGREPAAGVGSSCTDIPSVKSGWRMAVPGRRPKAGERERRAEAREGSSEARAEGRGIGRYGAGRRRPDGRRVGGAGRGGAGNTRRPGAQPGRT
ncbi:hypothetical protein GCM10010319_43040 [Streptomyces blastmyceticus]|uniref:Uncharacterized protein n=1 Tax=Streptomyces blastmyceticus TaxID=68180 RepID=A0ABN0XD28_9ACTN